MQAETTIHCPYCGVDFNEQDFVAFTRCPVCSHPLEHGRSVNSSYRGPIKGFFTAQDFVDPVTGRTERIAWAWLWTLLFGPAYFAYKGAWFHAVASFVALLLTLGLSWLVYPFLAARLLRKHYLHQGWDPL